MWRRAMQGHAVSNCMPVIAANRIGREGEADFYGHSFITDEWGDLTQQFGREETGVLVETIDLDRAAKHRAGMGFFRDRRPQLYGRLVEDICRLDRGRTMQVPDAIFPEPDDVVPDTMPRPGPLRRLAGTWEGRPRGAATPN